MFLMQKATHNLVEVLSIQELFDPFIPEVTAQIHAGEELQDPETFPKADLIFPSGETLPTCWTDPNYRGMQKKGQPIAA